VPRVFWSYLTYRQINEIIEWLSRVKKDTAGCMRASFFPCLTNRAQKFLHPRFTHLAQTYTTRSKSAFIYFFILFSKVLF